MRRVYSPAKNALLVSSLPPEQVPTSGVHTRHERIDAMIATLERARVGRDRIARAARLEQLRSAMEPLVPLIAKYWDVFAFLEPSGRNGRPLAEERDAFLEARMHDSRAVPTFTYPNAEQLPGLEEDTHALAELRATYEAITDPHVREVALHAHATASHRRALVEAVHAHDDARVMDEQRMLYGDLDAATITAAHAAWNRRREGEPEAPQSELARRLDAQTFDAEAIRTHFERACALLGVRSFQVIVSPSVSVITVKLYPADGGPPTIAIPPTRSVHGVQLLQLIAHEVGTHAVTNDQALALGLPLELGTNYELFQEGLAKRAERRTHCALTGAAPTSFDAGALPYFVLGLERVQEGGNFRDVFELLLQLHAEERLHADGVAHTPRARANAATSPQLQQRAFAQCRRLFRGFHDLSVGGRAYFRDKVYFEGALLAEQLERAGVAGVLLKAKIDPWIAEHLLEAGVLDRNLPMALRRMMVQMLHASDTPQAHARWERTYQDFMGMEAQEEKSPQE